MKAEVSLGSFTKCSAVHDACLLQEAEVAVEVSKNHHLLEQIRLNRTLKTAKDHKAKTELLEMQLRRWMHKLRLKAKHAWLLVCVSSFLSYRFSH